MLTDTLAGLILVVASSCSLRLAGLTLRGGFIMVLDTLAGLTLVVASLKSVYP